MIILYFIFDKKIMLYLQCPAIIYKKYTIYYYDPCVFLEVFL